MALISGPVLDDLVRELTAWYIEERERLIQALEEGYPYGSIPLTPKEQVARFIDMTPEEWESLVAKLTDRHRGKPKADELVREDLEAFVKKMNRMAFTRRDS